MKKPRPGIVRRPRELEKLINELVDEVNSLSAEPNPEAEAKAEAKAETESEVTNETG